MTEDLELLIADCFEQIAEQDVGVASTWVKQLFDKKGNIKSHMITEFILRRLENDLMRLGAAM